MQIGQAKSDNTSRDTVTGPGYDMRMRNKLQLQHGCNIYQSQEQDVFFSA